MDEEKVQQLKSVLPVTGVGAGALLLVFLVGNVFMDAPFETTRPEARPFVR